MKMKKIKTSSSLKNSIPSGFFAFALIFASVTSPLSNSLTYAVDAPDHWNALTGEGSGVDATKLSWQGFDASTDGTVLVGIVDYYSVMVSTDSGASWRKHTPQGDPLIQKITVSPNGETIMLYTDHSTIISTDFGETWNERDAPSGGFNDIALSYDGSHIAAIINNFYIYTSTDGGATWVEQTEAGSREWKSISSSSDGTKIIALPTNGLYYVSLDGGATWVSRSGAGSQFWSGIEMSADGSKVVAYTTTSLLVSQDGGINWGEPFPVADTSFKKVSLSSSGLNIAVIDTTANDGVDSIWTSSDTGATWVQHDQVTFNYGDALTVSEDGTMLGYMGEVDSTSMPLLSYDSGATWTLPVIDGLRAWIGVASSNDGAHLIAVDNNPIEGYVYLSVDSGATWQKQLGPGTHTWSAVASSGDGSKLIATASGGYLYTSTDSGATWQEHTDLGMKSWRSVATSNDGITIIALSYNGVYVSHDSGDTWTAPYAFPGLGYLQVASATISADGTKIALAYNNDSIAFSTDSGITWSQHDLRTVSIYSVNTVAFSSDGSNLAIAGVNDSFYSTIYTSTDLGETWNTEYSLSSTADIDAWEHLAYVGTGTDIIASSILGELYVSSSSRNAWNLQSFTERGGFNSLISSSNNRLFVAQESGYIYSSYLTDNSGHEDGFTFEFTPSTVGSSAPTSTNPAAPQPITNTRPTFSGVSTPFATISITVHSDPITCTTTADASGNWSCTLPSTIPPGVHTILVEVTDPDTLEVKTVGPYYVEVASNTQTVVNATTPLAPNTGVQPLMNSAISGSTGSKAGTVPSSAVIESYGAFVATALLIGLLWMIHITLLRSKQRSQ